MKKLFHPLVAAAIAISAFAGLEATTVHAAPVAVITAPATTAVHVGDTVTFDATTSSCSAALSCTYKWVESYRNPRTFATVTIAQRGTGRSTSITFTAADATRDYVTVQLIVTDNNSTHNFRSDQINIVVTPAPPPD